MIVIDASVLTDFLLGRPQALAALEREWTGSEHEPLHAPDLIELETLNALRRLARNPAVGERRASEAVSDLADARMVRYPHTPLRARIWELRHELAAHDAAYLALAEVLGDAVLVTGDSGLAARAMRSLGERRVRLVP